MFMVLSPWQRTSRVHPVHMTTMEPRQAAAHPQPMPKDHGCESACRLPVSCLQAARSHTRHRHLLLLLSPKADTHFTIPWRVEGWSLQTISDMTGKNEERKKRKKRRAQRTVGTGTSQRSDQKWQINTVLTGKNNDELDIHLVALKCFTKTKA